MKKTLFITFIAACSFTIGKQYALTEGEAVITFKTLETARKAIPTSEVISAKEATEALQGIDSIQKVLYKISKDTTSKK